MVKERFSSKVVLLVDAGNSAVKWGVSADLGHISELRERYPEHITADFFSEQWKDLAKPTAVFVSCVAKGQVWNAIEQACLGLWEIKPVKVISPHKEQGLTNAYIHAADLGSDRWCVMLAAYQQADKSACIIIDCGTAITIDVVDPAGQHRGGYILPGLEMMLHSLGMQTANIKLDKNEMARLSLAPADSTTACVLAGTRLAAVAAIETVVLEQQKEFGKVRAFVTGGDASVISSLMTVQHEVVSALVLQGLALIAAEDLKS